MARKSERGGKAAAHSRIADADHEQPSDSGTEFEDGAGASSTYEHAVNLPAHQTKHVVELTYRFPSIHTSFKIVQRNDTNSTGSSLWLSSQVLSSYLLHTYCKPQVSKRFGAQRRMLELGSGTGLLSLLMARLGWKVIATDIPPVLDSVLEPNVKLGVYQLVNAGIAGEDQIHVAELDWMVEPDKWHWDPELDFPTTKAYASSCRASIEPAAEQHFDLILTADTIYEPSLIRPLFSTLAHLYQRKADSKPTVLLALERRDPAHIIQALEIARQDYALAFKQIPAKRVRKIFDTLGDGTTWSRDDWNGVEIWKL
ncbi:uncharacterized protein MEPE_04939 [Melanopsichium pennsylvanicum]|uniref:Uncharacterized protein n=2 Tax=Melanopsichium pennsylvanicum TaxID=63383 RepID=A0AAJ4XPP8_9BASI|nr:conserved hypothetical protein [Melanopsichium pennsylvanicum 4]SNX86230.1 uncharacterized protein MEPE_04939 [Melanopsichium pennsylvanicum]